MSEPPSVERNEHHWNNRYSLYLAAGIRLIEKI
jgi:hypothetical protein